MENTIKGNLSTLTTERNIFHNVTVYETMNELQKAGFQYTFTSNGIDIYTKQKENKPHSQNCAVVLSYHLLRQIFKDKSTQEEFYSEVFSYLDTANDKITRTFESSLIDNYTVSNLIDSYPLGFETDEDVSRFGMKEEYYEPSIEVWKLNNLFNKPIYVGAFCNPNESEIYQTNDYILEHLPKIVTFDKTKACKLIKEYAECNQGPPSPARMIREFEEEVSASNNPLFENICFSYKFFTHHNNPFWSLDVDYDFGSVSRYSYPHSIYDKSNLNITVLEEAINNEFDFTGNSEIMNNYNSMSKAEFLSYYDLPDVAYGVLSAKSNPEHKAVSEVFEMAKSEAKERNTKSERSERTSDERSL